jgi:hypothetical protein
MTRTAWLVALALAPAMAHAQLFKCKGPDGKIVYSDTRCEGSDKGAIKVTPNSSTLSEREKAMAEKAAADAEAARQQAAEADRERRSAPPPASTSAAEGPRRYELTGSDRERLRELEMTAGSLGASPEQKDAARFEMARIRSGDDARLSSDARSRRDSLRVDLSSADAKKRRQVLQQFRSLYY